jgi:hypothetical protein
MLIERFWHESNGGSIPEAPKALGTRPAGVFQVGSDPVQLRGDGPDAFEAFYAYRFWFRVVFANSPGCRRGRAGRLNLSR